MSSEEPNSTSGIAECRACLQKLETEQSYNLFQAWSSSWEGMKSTIAEDLSVLAEVQLKETDNHSKLICSSCCTNLWNACKFKLLVQANDKILRQRYPETGNQVPVEKEWPQPIQLETNITGLYNNSLQVEIKQEVLSDEEYMGNGEEGYTSTNCIDMIKIEPEEIAEPVTSVPPSFRITQINGQECLEEEDETPMDSETVEDKARGIYASKQNTESETKQIAPLTHADVMEAVAEALSIPVEVHKKVQLTPELDTETEVDLTVSPSSCVAKKVLFDNTNNNRDSILDLEPTNLDEQLPNATNKPDNECREEQKTDESVIKEKPKPIDGMDIEVTDLTDVVFEIEPASPFHSDSDLDEVPVTTSSEPERAINKETLTIPTRYFELPPKCDTLGVGYILPVAKKVEVSNNKETRGTSKLITPKTEATKFNDDNQSETIPLNNDVSLATPKQNDAVSTKLALSSEMLKKRTVPKPLSIQSETKKIYMNTNKEISQKIDSLSETVATVIENQKVMADTQEKILAHVMGMSSQFEQFVKNSQNVTSHNIKPSSRLYPFMERCPSHVAVPEKHFFKPIDNVDSLQAFEESLKDDEFEAELKHKFLAMCGRDRTGSNCYILVDLLFDRTFLTKCSWAGGSRDESTKYLQTVKEEPLSEPEDSESAADLPMDCLLCARSFSSVSGLKAHVIAQHSYKTVERRAGDTLPHRTQNNKYVCATCRRTFVTSTDLMVHETCHNKQICYGCSAKFDTFDQLTAHRRLCKALSSPGVKRLKTLEDVKRPRQENNIVTEIKIEINNVTSLTDSNETLSCPQCNEVFSDPYYMKIHQEVHHTKEEVLDVKSGIVPMEIEALESIFTEET